MFESEIAFVITKKSLDIVRDIAGISSIGGYELWPRPRLRITDTYYDTRQALLGKRKIGLRTRGIGGKVLVSIKSSPRRVSGLGVRRNEFESSWSSESLTKIAKILGAAGIRTNKPPTEAVSPSKVFAKMGLVMLQQRHTTRDVRDVLLSERPAARIAEVDIDRVTFLGTPKVQIFEVEIEAKAPGSLKVVQKIAAELESNYSGFLRVWPHSKLVTGLAIKRLWKSSRLSDFLQNGRLKSGAFDVMDRAISSGYKNGLV